MHRKIYTVIALALLSGISYLAVFWFENDTAEKVFLSAISTLVLYAVISLGIEEVVARRFSNTKTRYAIRKAISLLLLVVIIGTLLRIWIPNPEALLVAYGVVAAGIAIALQDLVKNLAGSVIIFLGGIYEVGNRIEVNGTYGDVIDIDLFNTTLLEIREWIDADQATGRITTIPNGAVLNTPVQNFTKHHRYLWDELSIEVTGNSDWKQAMELLTKIGEEETKDVVEEADKSLTKLERYYYVEGHVLKPNAYIVPSRNGYTITLRYAVNAWKRRSTHTNIWTRIITAIEENEAIAIAPVTNVVVREPKVKRST